MKKKYLIIILIILFCGLIIGWICFRNSSYYKLNNLYNNPIKINQVYGDYEYDEYKNHVTILSYSGEEEVVYIPEKINNKKVLSIDDSAFYSNFHVKKVVVPDSVIRIGHQTFIGDSNLKEVYLPDGLLDIGGWAFDGCPRLEKIYVKKGSKTEKSLNKTMFAEYIEYK